MSERTLFEAATSLPRAWFAVADGGHFDDLPAMLTARRLIHVPLYLEASGDEGVRAGPHLVALDTHDEVATLIELTAGKPALTFWSWPGTMHMLRRHLRGLNLAEIPNERREGPGDAAYETVLFRHWDPNVLAVTLPVLTEEQRSRFVGDAAGLAFDANDYAGVTLATRPEGLPEKPRGMLRFEVGQIEGIAERRAAATRERIANYVLEVAPEQTAGLEGKSLRMMVDNYIRSARGFGLTSERDLGRWAFLEIATGGAFAADDAVRAMFLATDYRSASRRLDVFFQKLEDQSRRAS